MSTNIAAKINKMIPNVPEMILVKYKTRIIAASTHLVMLSVKLMFFFIVIDFVLNRLERRAATAGQNNDNNISYL